jgi:VanZ family protein
MAVIMWFSTGDFSAERTGGVLSALLRWLLPEITAPQIDAIHGLVRKSAHVTEYAVLSALWFVALAHERGWSARRAAWGALLVGIAWAFLDELNQATEPSRTASAADVAIDATGALAAAVVGRYGWGRALDRAATALLWIAALGGAGLLAINVASGVASGVLWITAPAAALAVIVRRLRP